MVVEFVTPFRERTLELLDDQAHLTDVLAAAPSRPAAVAEAHPARRLPAGRLRRARHSVGSSRADHRSRRRDPGALGEPSSRTTGPSVGDTTADDDPHPHHAGPADRGRRRPLPSVEAHLADVGRQAARRSRPPARHRHLPAGLAGRLRDRSWRASPSASSSPPPYAGAARHRPPLPLPPARDHRPPPRATPSSTGPSRSSPAFECEFDVTDFHLYVHDEEAGWQPDARFALRPAPAVT